MGVYPVQCGAVWGGACEAVRLWRRWAVAVLAMAGIRRRKAGKGRPFCCRSFGWVGGSVTCKVAGFVRPCDPVLPMRPVDTRLLAMCWACSACGDCYV